MYHCISVYVPICRKVEGGKGEERGGYGKEILSHWKIHPYNAAKCQKLGLKAFKTPKFTKKLYKGVGNSDDFWNYNL